MNNEKNAVEKYGVCNENCNGILSRLYAERDRIGTKYDRLVVAGRDTSVLDEAYDRICEEIREICQWRKTHDCLLEGDPGFRYC